MKIRILYKGIQMLMLRDVYRCNMWLTPYTILI